MASGGYRKPAHPAPVSGPGALSQRTDGGPGQPVRNVTGLGYGDAQAFRTQQQGAPMAQGQGPGPALMSPMGPGPQGPPQQGPPGPPTGAPAPVVPLHAPTQFPGEPITAGAPFGPGPGRAPAQAGFKVTDLLGTLLGSDVAGDLADLYLQAERMGM